MGVVSLGLVLTLLIRRKRSVYGAIVLGLTVFVGLFLLDTAVVARYLGSFPHDSGYGFTLGFERLLKGSRTALVEFIANIAVFVPFGLFLSESLSEGRRLRFWKQIGIVCLMAFGLSLCIEMLQLILHVGFFEVKDLVTNTFGAFIGAVVALAVRRVFRK